MLRDARLSARGDCSASPIRPADAGRQVRLQADPAACSGPARSRRSGSSRTARSSTCGSARRTIRDANGAFVRSRSAARDVTENRRLANACTHKAEELSRANIQLRRINQELEEFTYVVSHDLKEPLRTLEAFSNFLAQDYGPLLEAEGQEYINHLIQASRRLGR